MRWVEQYELKYDFGEWNNRIRLYLNKVLKNSTEYFAKQYSNGEIKNVNHEYESMLEYISNIEEYLFYNKNNSNFYNILKSLENINVISVLPKNRRDIYGQAIPRRNILLINPDLSGNRTLTSKERTRLYVAHELGHFVNNEWMKSVVDFSDGKVRLGEMGQNEAVLFQEGFSLLNEAITQNRAEHFAYAFARKSRPPMKRYTNGKLFHGEAYQTNFDFYGELQTPATMFGRTLRGIGKMENDEAALMELCNRANNPNFAKRIIEEYTKDGQLRNLFPMVENMGIIKKASYYMFGGDDDVRALNGSKTALDSFRKYANSLRDYREPLTSEYGNR